MQLLNDMTLEEQIAQMLLVGFYCDNLEKNPEFMQELKTYSPGGVIYFTRYKSDNLGNLNSPEQIISLSETVKNSCAIPPFIAADQEGGIVARLDDKNGYRKVETASEIGNQNDYAITKEWASYTARILNDSGINLNLAPVVDLDIYRESPAVGKHKRSFSVNEEIVTRQAGTFCKVMHEHSIYNCLKHFPGHGSAREDSHLGFTDITQTWQERELYPYRELFTKNYIDMVMVCHVFHRNMDDNLPASLSPAIVNGLLRKELGWDGVTITDDLQMKAISEHYSMERALKQAILAGNDLLLVANNDPNSYFPPSKLIEIIKDAVTIGEITPKRIAQSCKRILALKRKHLIN